MRINKTLVNQVKKSIESGLNGMSKEEKLNELFRQSELMTKAIEEKTSLNHNASGIIHSLKAVEALITKYNKENVMKTLRIEKGILHNIEESYTYEIVYCHKTLRVESRVYDWDALGSDDWPACGETILFSGYGKLSPYDVELITMEDLKQQVDVLRRK